MIVGTEAEYQSDAGFTNDTPYLALTGELWGIFCEYLWENWLCYSGTALYFQVGIQLKLKSLMHQLFVQQVVHNLMNTTKTTKRKIRLWIPVKLMLY